jgi:hypothetical protein
MRVLGTFVAFLMIATPAAAQNAKSFWKDFVKNCASNDLISGRVLYMGPDNADGPGTVFRKVGGDWHHRRAPLRT